tara:strand:+ start:1050 stop:2120 length:1071 start_codon:yes stop_codon:yes gene_type:complete
MQQSQINADLVVVQLANQVCEVLQSAGFEGYLVGGCVRDALLNKEPTDCDIATNATPNQVEALFDRTTAVGKAFGTITAHITHNQQQHAVEITTYRSESTYTNQRHPDQVTFETSLQLDIKRRDFTINALAYDPISKQLIDMVDGVNDLTNKTLKVVGDPAIRFNEDTLRLIRCCRFMGQLQFSCDAQTWETLCLLAPSVGLPSKERLTNELQKIVETKHGWASLKALEDCGLIDRLLPGFKGMTQLDESRFLLLDADQRLALLIGHSNQKAVFESLRLSKKKTQWMTKLIQYDLDTKKAAFKVADIQISSEQLIQLGFKGRALGQLQQTLKELIIAKTLDNTTKDIVDYIKANFI